MTYLFIISTHEWPSWANLPLVLWIAALSQVIYDSALECPQDELFELSLKRSSFNILVADQILSSPSRTSQACNISLSDTLTELRTGRGNLHTGILYYTDLIPLSNGLLAPFGRTEG